MGLFSKRTDNPTRTPRRDDNLAELDAAWQEDPVAVLALFVQNTGSPRLTVAHLLVRLVTTGVVSRDELAAIGVDEVELRRVVADLQRAEPNAALYHEAEVRAALRAYRAVIDEIVATAGVVLDGDQRMAFEKSLARFADENKLTDLKVAYRLMRAEVGDPLAGLPKAQQPEHP